MKEEDTTNTSQEGQEPSQEEEQKMNQETEENMTAEAELEAEAEAVEATEEAIIEEEVLYPGLESDSSDLEEPESITVHTEIIEELTPVEPEPEPASPEPEPTPTPEPEPKAKEEAKTGKTFEERTVGSIQQLFDLINEVAKESTVRRVRIKNKQGRLLMDIPMWAAAIGGTGAIIALPFLSIIGLVGGAIAGVKVEIEREES